jgi:hypothetical protein
MPPTTGDNTMRDDLPLVTMRYGDSFAKEIHKSWGDLIQVAYDSYLLYSENEMAYKRERGQKFSDDHVLRFAEHGDFIYGDDVYRVVLTTNTPLSLPLSHTCDGRSSVEYDLGCILDEHDGAVKKIIDGKEIWLLRTYSKYSKSWQTQIYTDEHLVVADRWAYNGVAYERVEFADCITGIQIYKTNLSDYDYPDDEGQYPLNDIS